MFNLLLSSGNDVNARDDNDHTCLHAAACSGSVTNKCCCVELMNIAIGLLMGCTLKRKLLYNVEVQCYIIDPKVIIINQNKNAHMLHFCDLKPSAQHYLPFVHNYVHMCTLG